MAEDGWYPDPTERFEFRWLANDEWTNSVWHEGSAQSDGYEAPTTSPAPTRSSASQTIGRAEAFAFASPPIKSPPATPTATAPPAFPGPPPAMAWPTPNVGGGPANGKGRLRTGVPGPVAWAAVFLSTPGLLTFLYGVVAVFLAGAIDSANNDFGNTDFGDDARNSVAGIGVFLLVVGGFYLAVAVCLMMAMAWARVAAIVLGCLHALISLVVLSQDNGEAGIIFLLIAGLQIGLLCTPTATQTFRTRAVAFDEIQAPFRS